MTTALIIVGVLAAIALGIVVAVKRSGNDFKFALKEGINNIFRRAEASGRVRRLTSFWTDYHEDYPELRLLEDEYKVIREECEHLLEIKDRLIPMEALGGDLTESPLHSAHWKTFVFKSGEFVEQNCALAPKTADSARV